MAAKLGSGSISGPKTCIAEVSAIRGRGAEAQLVEVRRTTSRRDLLGVLLVAPLAVGSTVEAARFSTPAAATSELIPSLRRTSEGRELSRVRYHNAESFFAPIEQGILSRGIDQLYYVGIALQLALSAHLLDVGFEDAWCARNIGLHLDKSLAWANATGLGDDDPVLKQLADFLSPYGKWRNPDSDTRAISCPFSHERICELARELLERVREVTGHPRPRTHRG